jgi:F0F1-type ATP synthase membrane subunit b/b'
VGAQSEGVKVTKRPNNSFAGWWWAAGIIGFLVLVIYNTGESARKAADERLRPIENAIEQRRQVQPFVDQVQRQLREQRGISPGEVTQRILSAQREAEAAVEQERRYREQIEYQRRMLESQRAIQGELQRQRQGRSPFE